MTRSAFEKLEAYMQSCMRDSAHDREHVYRVLYTALDIAAEEPTADLDVLITACLLHDIGRQAQYDDPAVCHAAAGAVQAQHYLLAQGYAPEFAAHVSQCIASHRFRKLSPPRSIEAKILFDADKLDVTGAMGIARTLLYNGRMDEPLYTTDSDGMPSDGSDDLQPSFFQEYQFKLRHIYDRFFTARGAALAAERRTAAEAFFRQLLAEASGAYLKKDALFSEILENL